MTATRLALLALAFAFAAPLSVADDAKKTPAELQGVWKLVSLEVGGESREPLGGNSPRWVVKDDVISYGGEELAKLTADATTTPKVIDLKFKSPDRVYEGIYSVEKDTLKVCVNKRAEGSKDRPGKFATKDQEDWVLMVFEREKKAPADATDGLTGFAGLRLKNGDDGRDVVVDAPIKDSPADKAGLKAGDVILKVGATAASDLDTTVKAVRAAKPGAKLDVVVSRDGKKETITVKVGVLPFAWVAGLE